MPTELLPKLHNNHNVGKFNDSGIWNERDADELKNISEGLDVNSQVGTEINSIPDIWARPLLFEMALLNPQHPLHIQILGEWRGLLAMLALREVKNLNSLSVESTQITEDSSSNFLRALYHLRPEGRSISPTDTSWENLFVFLYQVGHQIRPIGMTSPTTLVFTSSHYDGFINRNEVGWFNGETLQDPLSFFSDQEKQALSGWLGELHKLISARGEKLNNNLWNNLSGLLNKFRLDTGFNNTFNRGNYSFGMRGREAGIFVHLDTPAAAPVHEPGLSHVRVIPSLGRNPNVEMLIVDPGIAEEWGVLPSSVVITGAATLANIPQNGHIERHQIGSINVKTAELWKPQELFTENLYVVRRANAFNGTKEESWVNDVKPILGNEEVSIILPIKEKLLEYLTEDDLLSRLKFAQGTDNEITVTLNLPLGGGPGSYKFRKVYRRENIKDFEKVPILEVFPNFKSDIWRSYYVAYSADDKRTFDVKPFPNHEAVKEIPVKGNPNALRKIYQTQTYPQVLVCLHNGESVGVLLIKEPEGNLPALNREFTVGIDFGASGTAVYRAFGNDRQPVEFQDRKFSVTAAAPEQISQIFDFFLPTRAVQTPFLSFFQTFNNYQQNVDRLEPLLNGHTYYTDDERISELQNHDNLHTNLKWSDSDFERLCAKAFLSQICLQTAAELISEGAKGIEWKFSYPTAFSDAHINAFENVWDQIVKDVERMTGLNSNLSNSKTESLAAAAFFRDYQNHRAQTSLGTVFVDIGSSTSDVSVWQEDKLLWQISIPFAGQHIFLNYLYSNQAIRQKFNLPDPQTNDGSESDRRRFYAAADAVLRKENEQIFNRLSLISEGETAGLKKHLALGISGLFYYIGLGINCLREEGQYIKPEMPHFYFGGNGSQVFRWLTGGKWRQENNVYFRLFESVFKKAVNQELNNYIKIEMSSLPKREAAYGLVCDNNLTVNGDDHKIIFAGENFIEDGNRRDWMSRLHSTTLTDQLEPTAELENLLNFVKAFNSFASTTNGQITSFNPSDRQIADVRGRLSNDLSDLAHQAARQQTVVVQPIFIMELKHLLEV